MLTVVAFSAALAFVSVAAAPALLMVSAFAYGGLALSVYPLAVAHMTDHLDAEHALEATKGLLLLYGVGAVLGPVAGGVLMDWLGPGSLLMFMGVTHAALGVFGTIRMHWVPPVVPVEAQAEFVAMTRTSPVALEMDPRTDLELDLDGEPG